MHVWYGQAQKSRVSEGIRPRNLSKTRHSEIANSNNNRRNEILLKEEESLVLQSLVKHVYPKCSSPGYAIFY